MKRAVFQKRFWNRKLPMIATQSRGVKQHCDEIQFVVGRISAEQQHRARFRGETEVNPPNLTSIDGGHLPPPSYPASSRLLKPLDHTTPHLHFTQLIQIISDAQTDARLRQIFDDFSSTHGNKLTKRKSFSQFESTAKVLTTKIKRALSRTASFLFPMITLGIYFPFHIGSRFTSL